MENASQCGHRCTNAHCIPGQGWKDGAGRRKATWDIAGVESSHHCAGLVAYSLGLAERTKVLQLPQDDRHAQTN